MKIGPKYKIAKRLGAQVFEKTQGAKFALTAEKRNFSTEGMRARSNYGTQLLEKQRVRFTYIITAKSLANYVNKIIDSKTKQPESGLFTLLEKRLDNVVLRAGFGKTRFQAKQMVSHAHVLVNGKKMTISSYEVKPKDVITVRESSKTKGMFADFEERFKDVIVPTWLKVDPKSLTITIAGEPTYNSKESHFNLSEVIQFYKR